VKHRQRERGWLFYKIIESSFELLDFLLDEMTRLRVTVIDRVRVRVRSTFHRVYNLT